VERRHDAMWRAMGDGFNVHKKRFQEPEPMNPEVKKFHAYLTDMCRNAEFGQAVSATNYAVEGVAQKISEKALRGLAKTRRSVHAALVARRARQVRRRASHSCTRDHQGLRETRQR